MVCQTAEILCCALASGWDCSSLKKGTKDSSDITLPITAARLTNMPIGFELLGQAAKKRKKKNLRQSKRSGMLRSVQSFFHEMNE